MPTTKCTANANSALRGRRARFQAELVYAAKTEVAVALELALGDAAQADALKAIGTGRVPVARLERVRRRTKTRGC